MGSFIGSSCHRGFLTLIVLSAAGLLLDCSGSSRPAPRDPADSAGEVSPRLEFESIADRLYRGDNQYLGNAAIGNLKRLLKRTNLSDARRLEAMTQLGWQHLRVGDVDAAVSLIQQAYELSRQPQIDERLRADLLYMRGLTYLRLAEVQNCIVRHNRDCCIFPLVGGGVHTVPQPAVLARQSYEEYLQIRDDDRAVPWLLNVLSMAVGDYPSGVPAQYRIPPEAFRSEHEVGRFLDVAPALGIDTFTMCGGVVTDDLDGDGRLDVVTSTYDPRGPLALYVNRGLEGFDDRSGGSRLSQQLGGLNIVGADYDGDGDGDILVLRGAWLHGDGEIRNSLLRNDGDGTFTDVTAAAGLARPARPTQAAAWGDFDNDGDLDLYVGNESPREQPERYPSQLFRNNGDGTFTDVAAEAGVRNLRYAKGVAAGDFDNDGDLDLYVSNVDPNRLYRNEGGLRFVDVASELGLTEPLRSFATWFFDYDNDGWLDLFVAGYEAGIADVAADFLGQPHRAEPPRLYRNRGDGTFEDVAKEVGLHHAYLPMGANFGDLDNDGWLDVYLSTGDPMYDTLMPNVMLRNDAGRGFQDVTTSSGLGHLQKGHGVAFADLDNDGDQDIYHQLGGFFPGDKFHNALFLNPGHGNRFLTLELRGVQSNARGYGARVTVLVETPRGPREIHRAVGAVSSFGGSPARQEIGLGDATRVVALEVVWPTSGLRQRFDDVEPDAAYRVVEQADELQRLRLPVFDLGSVALRAGLTPSRPVAPPAR